MAGKSATFDPLHALSRMRNRTDTARDAVAAILFAPEAVNAALSDAAAKGLTAAYLAPLTPMDLRQTEAAKTIVDQLKAAKFVVEWKLVQANPEAEKSYTLRVSWGVDAAASG